MITGRERLGWTQRADSAAQLATFDYALYVDGSRRPLAGESCTASGAAFACSVALPPLTPGAHALALAAFVTVDGAVVESAPSTPLQVTVTGATSPAAIEGGSPGVLVTPEGARLHTAVVERGLHDPADLAAAPDGRLFVAERSGAIAIVSPDLPHATLEDRPLSRFESLESLAVDPAFARTRRVLAVYRTLEGFTIVRLREAAGRFGEAAVVREIRAPAAGVSALARFGPDRKLYVFIGAGPDPLEPQNPASPLGKILRFEEDGTIPRDNPGPSPVFSSGHHDARGLTWDSQTGILWSVEWDEAGDELNAVGAGLNYGWPLARGTNAYPGAVPAIFTCAPGTDVGGAAFVPRAAGGPFAGTLLVAARGAQDLLRMSLAPGPTVNAGGRLLHGRFGRIGHVVAAGGSIYVTTANSDLWGPGQDLLIELWADER
jgi:glucose/arabinose dehydrogenase